MQPPSWSRAAYLTVRAYLRPYSQTPTLRRGGTVLTVNRTWPAADPTRWTIESERTQWAQVALPDRAFDDVRDITDENQPFLVMGTLTDDDLTGIVRFLRGRPTLPFTHANHPKDRLQPAWAPISGVSLGTDGVIRAHVRTEPGSSCSDQITMTKRDSAWTGSFAWVCIDF